MRTKIPEISLIGQEALEVQSEMVKQVTECTSSTISAERARCTEMSIALDQAEERLEKLEKEYKDTKQKLGIAEKLQTELSQPTVCCNMQYGEANL